MGCLPKYAAGMKSGGHLLTLTVQKNLFGISYFSLENIDRLWDVAYK